MKQAVQVVILGQPYTIRSDAPVEEVRRVASLVNEQVAEVAASGRTVDTLNLAILALMNMGGSLLRLQDGHQEETQAADRLQRLVDKLELAFPDQTRAPGETRCR